MNPAPPVTRILTVADVAAAQDDAGIEFPERFVQVPSDRGRDRYLDDAVRSGDRHVIASRVGEIEK